MTREKLSNESEISLDYEHHLGKNVGERQKDMEETNITTEQATETAAAEPKTFTQDEVNEIVSKRLEKESKKYSGYYSEDDLKNKTEKLTNQITDLGNLLKVVNDKATTDAQTIADLEAKVQNYETDSVKIRVALEHGIPYELANKLSGDTKDEIEADAEKMAKYLAPKSIAPLRNPESSQEQDGVLAAFRALNPNLKI